jgi:hypothetical protein
MPAKACWERNSMKLLGCLFVLFCTLPAEATLVVFQWTPQIIYLAADSLTLKVRSNKIIGVDACKLHQQGDIVFTIVGINDDPSMKIDLVTIAKQAAHMNGTIEEKLSAFDKLARTPIERLLHAGLAVQKVGPDIVLDSINIVFVSIREHALARKEYSRQGRTTVTAGQTIVYGVGGGRLPVTDYTSIGVYVEAQAAVDRDPVLSRAEGVPFIAGFLKAQIAHEQARLQQHQIPRVGGSICILQITGGTAARVTGYQKPCPDISRQGPVFPN